MITIFNRHKNRERYLPRSCLKIALYLTKFVAGFLYRTQLNFHGFVNVPRINSLSSTPSGKITGVVLRVVRDVTHAQHANTPMPGRA